MIFLYYDGNTISYSELERDIKKEKYGHRIIYEKNIYDILFRIIHSMYYEYPIVLLDYTLSKNDCIALGYNISENNEFYVKSRFASYDEFLKSLISKNISWELTLFTSGTTGRPKVVIHTLDTLTRTTRSGERYRNDSWAFAYNPTHIAGIQVFLQALFNYNSIYYLFGDQMSLFTKVVNEFKINRVSATPTYYRNIMISDPSPCESIASVTCGGEQLSAQLVDQLRIKFPNARIHNIYAATEFGSLFQSDGDIFEIPDRIKDQIKINCDGNLLIHRSLLGQSKTFMLINDWYNTGDVVKKIDQSHFIFVSRASSFINVGGYKVNPIEVEEKLEQIQFVRDSRVYSIANSITQNLVAADIVLRDDVTTSQEELIRTIHEDLKQKLPKYAIPRIIKFVDKIENTRTGKKIRK